MAGSVQRQKVYVQVTELCLLAKALRAASIPPESPAKARQINPRLQSTLARATDHRQSGPVGDHLPPPGVVPDHPGRTVEPDRFQVPQHRVHGRRPRPSRSGCW